MKSRVATGPMPVRPRLASAMRPTPTSTPALAALATLIALATLPGCGPDHGAGTVDVRISGQDFVELGWPSQEGDSLVEFDDGWAVQFDHVVIAVSAFRLADSDQSLVSEQPPSILVDVRSGATDLWTLTDVPAQRWPNVGYRFTAPDAKTKVIGDIPQTIVAAMGSEQLSMWIEGHGTLDDRDVHFIFGIPRSVELHHCWNGNDDTDGMVVGEGRTSEVELTLHMDHLFWDDHDADEPRLLFGPLAFAANSAGEVRLDDLAQQRLTDLSDADGTPLVDDDGKPIVYIPRVQLSDNDLREYMIDTALTIGHFNGEGHCKYNVQP